MRTLARFVGRFFLSVLLGLGWLVLFLVLFLWIGEKSGGLTVLVRDAIAREADSLGADLAIGDVSLDWFALEVRLLDLTLGRQGDAAHLREIRVRFDVEGGGIEIERAEIDGGHVRLSPALYNGIRGFSSRMAARGAERRGKRRIPTLLVRDLQVDYDTARFGRVPLAKIELLLESDAAGEATLSGHAIPSLSASPSGSGEIYLSGQQPEPGGFAVRAWATKLPISTDYLPRETELEFLRAWKPGGTLGLEAEARFRLDGASAARGTARLALEDGRLLVLGEHPVDDLRADLEVALAPSAGDLSDASAWHARARVDGRLDGFRFSVVGRHGETDDASTRAQVSVHVPELPLSEKLLSLLGGAPANVVRWNAFDARGTAEVSVAARLPASTASQAPNARIQDALEIGLEVALDGDAGLTYHGWPNHRTGLTDQGFPLPIDAVKGAVVFARAPLRPRPAIVGLVDLEGTSEIGTIAGFGTIVSHPVDAPTYLPGHGNGEVDLSFATPRLVVGAELERALAGLSGVVREDEVWQAYRPAGGAIGVDLRMLRNVEMESVATALTIDVDDVALAWSDLPIPLEHARGRVRFLADGHGEHGVGVALASGMRTAQDLAIALRLQSEPRARARERSGALSEIELVDLAVARMSLTGDDKQILVARYPVIESAMAEMQPRGFADVLYRRVRDGTGAATRTTSEISTREVQIQPRQFRMNTNAVRGRVLIDAFDPAVAPAGTADAHGAPTNGHPPEATEKPRVDTRLMPLVGLWGQDVQVAFFADFSEDRVHVFGAGIDPSNKGLLGALAESIEGPGATGIDMTALGARGLIDFTGEIELVDEPEEGAATTEAAPGPAREAQKYGRLFLRGNELAAANFHLEGLRGVLDWQNGAITGSRLQARLAETPVALSGLSFTSGAEGFRLDTRISAENLPLDREHLRSFLDEETLDALLGELRWRGRVDLEDGRITITGPPSGEGRLEFEGKVTPNDMFVQLGLPISIRSATARIEELILEGGRLRGVVRIDDLYGQVADRELGPAKLLVTYVEPRLSIENLEGELEGGHVLPLGADAERGGTAFSLDLEEPFPFQLALELRDVEVAGLLRGLFPSNIATRGLLSCELRLVGNTENLLGIEGSGSFQVRETRLWSVPVFRALFSQLGFDNTAVFDRMATNVRVRKGVIEMNDIAIHSPLLQLVGEGTLDFDGSLEHDLDVRYDLVDRLGPLTRLLYAIQNKLLSIAIRGDMSRPEVILKSPFRGLFGGWKTRERALPLPEYAPLPARF